jgi:hypothetical protein
VKRQLSIGLAVLATILVAFLAAQWSSVRAQPVASITMPDPGGTVQLYGWCNNIAITFPEGTPSEEVVHAVNPPDAVESLWRHSSSQNRFEGFNPQFAAASDLMSVHFLDAVWLCMRPAAGATAPSSGGSAPGGGGTSPGGGQPAATPTSTSTSPTSPPPPPPAQPSGTQADLAVTDLFPQNLPAGAVSLRVTNNGPDSVTNAVIDLSCSVNVTPTSGIPYGHGVGSQITVTLNPGQTAAFPSGVSVDTDKGTNDVTCEITMPAGWSGDNPSNNSYSETYLVTLTPHFLTADIAVTDIYPDNWPNGKLFARVMNFGPDTVSGHTLELGCSYVRHEILPPHGQLTIAVAPALITPTLSKGQSAVYDVHINVQGTQYWYDVTCNVSVPINDPNLTNNSYNEVFPQPP